MEEKIIDEIKLKADDNISYLKGLLKDNSDIIFREFNIDKWKAGLVYIDGMGDKILLDDYVLQSVMLRAVGIKSVSEIKDKILTVTDIREVNKMSDAVKAMLSGDTLMFIDELNLVYIIASRAWSSRGITEPSGETSVRGSKDGFTETIRFNTALIRRRIRDTRLKLVLKSLGIRSKTDVVVLYIDDVVDQDALEELNKRMGTINIDAVLDSSYVEQYIEDHKNSPFPQVQSTERPDVVAAALYEGRIVILVDNSPFALIIPATLPMFLQSPDDYYQRWIRGSLIRIIRFAAIFLSLILPAMYIAVTSFHSAIIPTRLAYSIAASREGVPFPAFIETIIMEISLAFLVEAITRLPKAIGATIGIVGGVIIGQAAVSAGIVSPIMIIIVSITAITTFITPNYEVTFALAICRFILIILSAIIGLYGIMLGLIGILVHLLKMKSFGVPYLSPMVNTRITDLKDFMVRLHITKFKHRPGYMKTGDEIRQNNKE